MMDGDEDPEQHHQHSFTGPQSHRHSNVMDVLRGLICHNFYLHSCSVFDCVICLPDLTCVFARSNMFIMCDLCQGVRLGCGFHYSRF